MRVWLVTVLALGLMAPAVSAQEEDDGFQRAVFDPQLVLRHARDIGLTSEQRRAVTDELKRAQAELAPLQVDLSAAGLELLELIEESHIDEAAAAAKAAELFRVETQVKRRQFVLLIRIKNALTPEQQTKLRALRDRK